MKVKELFVKKKPTKNYIIVLLVSIFVIVGCFCFRTIYLNYLEQSNISLFHDKTINQINTHDFDFALTEVGEAILYVSYTDSKEINTLDRRLYKLFERRNLTDKIIYWDVTDIFKDGTYMSLLRNKFPEMDTNISIAPLIIYIKDGKAVEVITSEYSLLDLDKVKDMINKYGIE